MSSTSVLRTDPVLESSESPASSSPSPSATVTTPSTAHAAPAGSAEFRADQLARIEEKAARIEEKFARVETLMQRVETAAAQLGEVARKPDVDALTERVGRLPAFGALILASLLTSAVTAIAVTVLFRFVLR